MLLRFGVAVAVVGLVVGTGNAPMSAQPDEAEGGEPEGLDEPEGPADEAPDPGSGEGEPSKALGAKADRASKRRKGGRKRVEGHVVKEERLRRRMPPPPSGNLHLHRPIEGDSLKVNIFNPDGSYNLEAVRAASRILRCRRTNTDKDMEPRLLAILSHVFDHFGEHRIDVISGFRNQRKTSSYHYKGSASDVRVDGISAKRLKQFVETLDAGGMGIGIYPLTGFVHIDVRPPPSYRWTDYSRSNPDAEQKKPPPWVKRRRLQS